MRYFYTDSGYRSSVNPEEMLPYAPVLERVIDLVMANPRLSYGAALEQASRDLAIEVPADVQAAILRSAFQISLQGFPTKVES
jgi:hypothetical protein